MPPLRQMSYLPAFQGLSSPAGITWILSTLGGLCSLNPSISLTVLWSGWDIDGRCDFRWATRLPFRLRGERLSWTDPIEDLYSIV